MFFGDQVIMYIGMYLLGGGWDDVDVGIGSYKIQCGLDFLYFLNFGWVYIFGLQQIENLVGIVGVWFFWVDDEFVVCEVF